MTLWPFLCPEFRMVPISGDSEVHPPSSRQEEKDEVLRPVLNPSGSILAQTVSQARSFAIQTPLSLDLPLPV
jgi:hypothetical protein